MGYGAWGNGEWAISDMADGRQARAVSSSYKIDHF